MTRLLRNSLVFSISLAGFAFVGCKSYWIDVSVENHTGQLIRELEVDYPSASFGFDSVGASSERHYRLQTRGSGPIKVGYSLPNGQSVHASGPSLAEHEQGKLIIRLLPNSKVDFLPTLSPGT